MEFNVHFFIVLVISIITFLADILIYVLKLNYWLSIVLSAIMILGSVFIFKKKFNIKIKSDFNLVDLIFMFLLSIVLLMKIFFYDESYDVNMYHIYLQENPFIDKINFDFFPARTLNSYLFPLGDRMFYLSRMILGYRLGTILSYYTYIVLFYQTKRFINLLTNKKDDIKSSLFSTLIYFINIIYNFVGTYYIDSFSTIFILEIMYIIFKEKNLFKNKFVLCFSFLLSGIAVGIKVSNLLLIIPVYIYSLINNYRDLKEIKLKDIIISIILFMLPFSVYMLYNILQTGSPLFPYYNNIFKSVWFDKISWKDERFGLPNIWCSFIWPIVVVINPLKTYDTPIIDWVWGIGYIVTIINIIKSIICKEKNKLFELSILTFILSIIWAIGLMGYIRYATVLPILYIIVIGAMFIDFESKNIILKITYFVSISIVISIIIFPNIDKMYNNIKNFKTMVISGIKYNVIFFDRAKNKIHIDGAWVVTADDSKLAALVREEGTPIYNLEERFLNSELALKKKVELTNKELYTLIDFFNKEKKLEYLENNNFEIIEQVDNVEVDFLGKGATLEVYKIKYVGKKDLNL